MPTSRRFFAFENVALQHAHLLHKHGVAGVIKRGRQGLALCHGVSHSLLFHEPVQNVVAIALGSFAAHVATSFALAAPHGCAPMCHSYQPAWLPYTTSESKTSA
jgi:hypothetical protein